MDKHNGSPTDWGRLQGFDVSGSLGEALADYPFCPPWKDTGGASFDASPICYPMDEALAPAYIYIGRGSSGSPGDHKFYVVSAADPQVEYYHYTSSAGFYPSPSISNNGGTYYDVAVTSSKDGLLLGFLVK